MAYKVFVDANVILDFTLKRENYNDAKKIIELILQGKLLGFVTPAIIHIVGYWLTKAYGTKKAKEIILALLIDISIIDISHAITITALHSKINDIEDALQYYTALENKLEYFISEDKPLKKYSIPNLPIYNVKEFLKLFFGEP